MKSIFILACSLALLPSLQAFGCKKYIAFGALIIENTTIDCPRDACAHVQGSANNGLQFSGGGCDEMQLCNGNTEIQQQTFTRDEWNQKALPGKGLPDAVQSVTIAGNCCYEEHC